MRDLYTVLTAIFLYTILAKNVDTTRMSNNLPHPNEVKIMAMALNVP